MKFHPVSQPQKPSTNIAVLSIPPKEHTQCCQSDLPMHCTSEIQILQDKNKDAGAADKFKEISEAYDVGCTPTSHFEATMSSHGCAA